ncbi:MAG: hypothetical protein ABI318_23930 [Chthoniobacteraceae bacterium]
MIIEILVAQRQRVNALREQLVRTVIDDRRIAPVRETARQRASDAQLASICRSRSAPPSLPGRPPEKSATTLRAQGLEKQAAR